MNTAPIPLASRFGTDLSSREVAARLRGELVRLADACADPVVLDLADVRVMSDSFADELFAVLVVDRGEDWFREHVRIVDVSPFVRQTLLETVWRRTQRSSAVTNGTR